MIGKREGVNSQFTCSMLDSALACAQHPPTEERDHAIWLFRCDSLMRDAGEQVIDQRIDKGCVDRLVGDE